MQKGLTTTEVLDLIKHQGYSRQALADLALNLTREAREHNPGPRPVICGTMSMNGETSEWQIEGDNKGWQQWMVTRDEGFARVPYLDAMVDGLDNNTDAFEPVEEDEEDEDNDQ